MQIKINMNNMGYARNNIANNHRNEYNRCYYPCNNSHHDTATFSSKNRKKNHMSNQISSLSKNIKAMLSSKNTEEKNDYCYRIIDAPQFTFAFCPKDDITEAVELLLNAMQNEQNTELKETFRFSVQAIVTPENSEQFIPLFEKYKNSSDSTLSEMAKEFFDYLSQKNKNKD